MQKRTKIDYFVLWLKGLAMGAADVVPGVSGGTIAFVSGVYEELLTSINTINFTTFRELRTKGFLYVWKKINGNFLAALLLGIFTSIFSLAKLISWLLVNQPVLLWSFFFGLVVASVYYVARQVKKWNVLSVILLVLASFLAYYITTLEPLGAQNSSYIFLFLAGALAICAMILPGISGAFILVLIGAYKPVLEAIHNVNFKIITIVGAGAIVGLLTFSRILKWLFTHFKNYTLIFLTGFIMGSLNKIWPWKKVLKSTFIEGKKVVLKEESVLPFSNYENPQILGAFFLFITGFVLILLLEKGATSTNQ